MALPYQLRNRIRQKETATRTTKISSFDFQLFQNRPFWIWHKETHRQEFIKTKGQCCFNHQIGLPVKNGKEYPLFDYEKLIFDLIEGNPNAWIKKARGIGVTTFIIRYLVWKILYSDELDDKSIFLISGTREEFGNYIKKKMEELFSRRFPDLSFESIDTELWIKKTWIKVMPTKNIKDVRGYMDAAYLFIDEADHGDKQFQQELEPAITAYEDKSKGKTIMVSTPNAPGGLFERIERDKGSKYTKLFLDYSYGIDKIYTREFIEKKKLESEFEREYNLKYLGIIGNTLHVKDIERAVLLGKSYDPNRVVVDAEKILGLDPGWGSSAFGLVLLQVADGQIQILMAEEYERPRYEDMISTIMDVIRGLNRRNLDQEYLGSCKVYVDGSNPEFIISLKEQVGDIARWERMNDKILYCKKNNLDLARYMTVVPVPFSTEGKNMIMHTKELLEFETPLIAINPKFDKLISALRTAISDDLGKLDKEQTSYHNVLDAFRLSLKGIKIVKESEIG
jgi:hypothetical protein